VKPASHSLLFPGSGRATPRRVVVTGGGILTALGSGWQANAAGFRTGVLWAVGRLASVARADVELLLPEVVPSFADPDPNVRGLAVWCVLQAGRRDLTGSYPSLAADETPVEIYREGEFHTTSTRELLGNR